MRVIMGDRIQERIIDDVNGLRLAAAQHLGVRVVLDGQLWLIFPELAGEVLLCRIAVRGVAPAQRAVLAEERDPRVIRHAGNDEVHRHATASWSRTDPSSSSPNHCP